MWCPCESPASPQWNAPDFNSSSTRGIVTISLEIRTMTQNLILYMFGRFTFCFSALESVGINTNDFLGEGDPFWISQRISNHLRNAFAAPPSIATGLRRPLSDCVPFLIQLKVTLFKRDRRLLVRRHRNHPRPAHRRRLTRRRHQNLLHQVLLRLHRRHQNRLLGHQDHPHRT